MSKWLFGDSDKRKEKRKKQKNQMHISMKIHELLFILKWYIQLLSFHSPPILHIHEDLRKSKSVRMQNMRQG